MANSSQKNDPQTGRAAFIGGVQNAAANLAGPALDLAQGATAMQAAGNVLKDAVLEKLLGPTAILAGGLIGVLSVIRKIVRETQILGTGLANIAKVQQIEGKFETLLKSATLAKQRIEELYKFTSNSPFKFDDVAEANRILQALTKGAFSGAAAMTLVGDTAAATGQSLSETAEKVGKLYAALSSGRAIDKIAFQLQFTGLVTDGLLGKLENLEKSGAGFAEQWDEVTKVLRANEGGMKGEIKSLDSLQTKLDGASTLMATAFAEPFVDAQSKSIEVMTKATQNLTPVLRAVGSDLATVSGLVTDFKTGLIENTLASSGMATALRTAWEAGKGLFVTLGAITALNAMKGAAPAVAFITRSVGTARDSLKNSAASATGIAAKAAGATASEALAAGNLTLAASEGIVAAQYQITARAAALKAAAMQAAAGETGIAAVRNGVLAASSVVAAGGMSLLARAAVAVGSSIKSAFTAAFATPLGLLVTSIYATITSYSALSNASKKAADGLNEVTSAAADLNREFKRTEESFQTTDDWAAYMAKITDEIVKAQQAAAKFKRTLSERGTMARVLDFVSGADRDNAGTATELDRNVTRLRARRADSFKYLPTLGMGDKESEAFARDLRNAKDAGDAAFQNRLSLADDQAAVTLISTEIAKLKEMTSATLSVRDAQEKFNRSREKIETDNALLGAVGSRTAAEHAAREGGVTLGAGQSFAERRTELQAQARALENRLALEQSAGRAAGRAGGGTGAATTATQEALVPVRNHIALLDKVLAATDEVTAAENKLAAMRRASDSELIRNNQRLADLRKDASGSEAARTEIQAIEKRNLALLESVRIVDEEIKRTQQLEFERTRRANSAEILGSVTIPFDRRINAATASGDSPEVRRLSVLKEIATIERQIAQERAQGNSRQRIAELETQKAGIEAREVGNRREFLRGQVFDRLANDATIGGKARDAQAVRDAKTLEDMKREYRANGLTDERATSDFAARIGAEAANAGPRIITSSMQAIGGGGGFGTGRDPVAEATRRASAAAEASLVVQKAILAAVSRDGLSVVQ